MTRTEKKMNQFYKELLEWLEAGTPDLGIFTKDSGLCINLVRWYNSLNLLQRLVYNFDALEIEQRWRFYLYNGSPMHSPYPFGDSGLYAVERSDGTLYENVDRVAFIKKNAEQ